MEALDAEACAKIDEALRDWRQGDCVLGEQWFLSRSHVDAPLTAGSAKAAEEGIDVVETRVFGLVVVTQTCDIVRRCSERPFLEVCPLVEVDPDILRQIERGRRPAYAFVPGLADRRLAADLDRVMTLEKPVAASWTRVEGCRDRSEARLLALALARKRVRVAFPDDFTAFVNPLAKRLVAKHDKNSEEGRALRALREIRVRAAPSWNAGDVSLMFWFIRSDEEPDFEGRSWGSVLESWIDRLIPQGRFSEHDGVVATLDDLSARDFVESDPLDLDHLSARKASSR